MMPRRILMVTSFYPPYHVGGACTHVYYLANGLARAGVNVDVVFSLDAFRLKAGQKSAIGNYPNHPRVRLIPLKSPLGKLFPLSAYVLGRPYFCSQLSKAFEPRYDLIHYHNISLLGPAVLFMGKSKKLLTAHDHWLACPLNDLYNSGGVCTGYKNPLQCSSCALSNKRPPQLWRFTSLLEMGLSSVTAVIAPSKYMQNWLTSLKHPYIKAPIYHIANFAPYPSDGINAASEAGFFLFAGMLEPIKGLNVLLKAFTQLKGQRLVIAGRGSLEPYVRNFIRKKRLGDRVRFVGWLDSGRLYSYYRAARALILPSTCPENSPLSILEAMSVGTPTIGANVGGIPEILGEIEKGLLFKSGSAEGLVSAIRGFKNLPKKKLIRIFREKYSTEAYLKQYLELLKVL